MRTKQKIMKKSLTLGAMLLVAGILSFTSTDLFSHDVSAETFESAQGISFTFNPTVKITITGGTGASSDGLTIDNLTPGDYKDSNIITVTAGSNSPLGYTLSSTVGSSTYNSTELRRNGTETANIFTNLTANKASLSAFDPGYWGYSYSTNSGSTWISGDIVSGTSAGYNGLPIYTTASPIKLINSSSASESSVQFKIGARATSSQTSGTYSNVVNFIGIAKVVTTTYTINYNANAGSDTVTNMPTPNPLQGTDTTGNAAIQIPSNVPVRANYMFKGWCTSQTSDDTCSSDVVQPGGYVALNPGTSSVTANVTKNLYAMWKSNAKKVYIQDLTLADCQSSASSDNLTVTDRRDENDYTVKYINGQCWMTQNLRLTGTVSATDSNFSGSDFNVSQYSLDSNDSTYANHCDQTNGYNYACAKDSGSETTGAWYNYYAATAGTISSDSNTNPATSDICPSGWHLPSAPNTTANTDINKLIGNTTSGWQDPTPGLTAFGAVAGGLYYDGALVNTEYGYWWSATAGSVTNRCILYYSSSSGRFRGNSDNSRPYGYFLRCVKSS